MSGVPRARLDALYADTDDPWRHRTSDYEAEKFAATAAALGRERYRAILELGCGNGELARRLSRRTDAYTGVDAVERALEQARRAVPAGAFHHLYLPAPLPDGPFGLVVLSEILYFLDDAGIEWLAGTLAARWPEAELLCVNWLGPTEHALSGTEALDRFVGALPAGRTRRPPLVTPDYRIDRLVPERVAPERGTSGEETS